MVAIPVAPVLFYPVIYLTELPLWSPFIGDGTYHPVKALLTGYGYIWLAPSEVVAILPFGFSASLSSGAGCFLKQCLTVLPATGRNRHHVSIASEP